MASSVTIRVARAVDADLDSLAGGTPTECLVWDAAQSQMVRQTIPVTSVFGRTGDVTLQSADVVTALGYTPANRAGDTFTGNVQVPKLGIGLAPTFMLDIAAPGDDIARFRKSGSSVLKIAATSVPGAGSIKVIVDDLSTSGFCVATRDASGTADRFRIQADGRHYIHVPNTAPDDARLWNSSLTLRLDESNGLLMLRARYSTGALHTFQAGPSAPGGVAAASTLGTVVGKAPIYEAGVLKGYFPIYDAIT